MLDMKRIMVTMMLIKVALLITCTPWCTFAQKPLPDKRVVVGMTLVPQTLADTLGAYCLDGSVPAYHMNPGFGPGARNWILQFEGGGWCNDLKACEERAKTNHGSTKLMTKVSYFTGILSNDSSLNPDFYNWNRVKIRYCDGASFTGNSKIENGTTLLYFRGQKIWQAVIQDLLPKGLKDAEKALLSGSSAGGFATFSHCDNFTNYLPSTAIVKCMSDAGFFLDMPDLSQQYRARTFYDKLISLQGVELNYGPNCTNPQQCIFPQNVLGIIRTPYFILNTAYDIHQLHHYFAHPSADPQKHWTSCMSKLTACSVSDIDVLQGVRNEMLKALDPFYKNSAKGGMFINSCFGHGQSESQENWFAPDSPRIQNTTIAEAVGNWYFERKMTKLIGEPYPRDTTCHHLM